MELEATPVGTKGGLPAMALDEAGSKQLLAGLQPSPLHVHRSALAAQLVTVEQQLGLLTINKHRLAGALAILDLLIKEAEDVHKDV